MDLSDMQTTEREAYGMAYSLALNTLKGLMADNDTDQWVRLYAAEAVLENEPKYKQEQKAKSKE